MSAGDVVAMLRAHYLAPNRPPGGIFATEVTAPGGRRRADVIWQGCTAAGGHELVGHEIKVSRADVLTELADPTKSHAWQSRCDRWWLVVDDPAHVDGLDLPATWGVMGPPSGRRTRSMTVHVPAPRLHPDDQAPALRALARWMHWRHTELEHARDSARADADRERRRADELRARVPRESRHEDATRAVVDDVVRRLGGALVGEDGRIGSWTSGSVDADAVVAALRDHAQLMSRADTERLRLRSMAGQLRRLVRDIDAADLSRLDTAFAERGGP